MRTLIVILILVVLAAIAAVATGIVDIQQTRPAELPEVSVSDRGVAAQGGRQPAFDVETGSVAVGSDTKAVTVPTLKVEGPERETNAAADTERADPTEQDATNTNTPAGS